MTFTLAIAGRPNVGKSTLFNRLIGRQMALVSDEPGVTRDWREGMGNLFNLKLRVLDTAGLEDVRTKNSISARTAAQTKLALEQTDVILLVVDGRVGITPDDEAVAREIRKSGKPIILVANKCEGTYLPEAFDETATLGFGTPIPISAVHAEGLIELHAALLPFVPAEEQLDPFVVEKRKRKPKIQKPGSEIPIEVVETSSPPEGEDLPDALSEILSEAEKEEEKHLLVAVVGRPNAGKSTLINQLIGEERMLTGPEPGLTRDAIPIAWSYNGQLIRLIDTAGLRRRAKVTEKLEKMSGHESLRAIRLAHVVVLVIDAEMPFDKQDLTIAHHVIEEGRALVVAINKWDKIKEKNEVLREIGYRAEDSLAQVAGLPLIPISALNGNGVEDLMNAVMNIYQIWNKRISTGQLNRWLEKMEDDHPPPITANRRIKLRYMTQVKSRPPTFSLWVNKPVDLPESYKRFLTHGLRDTFGLEGVPIRWQMKKSENPYLEEIRKSDLNTKKPRLGKSRTAIANKNRKPPRGKQNKNPTMGKKRKGKAVTTRLGKKARAAMGRHAKSR